MSFLQQFEASIFSRISDTPSVSKMPSPVDSETTSIEYEYDAALGLQDKVMTHIIVNIQAPLLHPAP
jgi:hypothetical protein